MGFTLTLALEGQKKQIKANCVAPYAASRMSKTVMSSEMLEALPASSVAKFVAFLCHEQCLDSGGLFELGGNWVSKVRWQRSKGVQFQDGFGLEDISSSFSELCDFSEGAEYPTEGMSGMGHAMEAHQRRAKKAAKL